MRCHARYAGPLQVRQCLRTVPGFPGSQTRQPQRGGVFWRGLQRALDQRRRGAGQPSTIDHREGVGVLHQDGGVFAHHFQHGRVLFHGFGIAFSGDIQAG